MKQKLSLLFFVALLSAVLGVSVAVVPVSAMTSSIPYTSFVGAIHFQAVSPIAKTAWTVTVTNALTYNSNHPAVKLHICNNTGDNIGLTVWIRDNSVLVDWDTGAGTVNIVAQHLYVETKPLTISYSGSKLSITYNSTTLLSNYGVVNFWIQRLGTDQETGASTAGYLTVQVDANPGGSIMDAMTMIIPLTLISSVMTGLFVRGRRRGRRR